MSTSSRFRLTRPSKVVADELRTKILLGELGQDGRLSSATELANQLGVSLHHLREALRLLEQDGLLQVHRGHTGGIFLTVPEVDSLARTFEGILARRGAVLSDPIDAFSALAATAVEVAAKSATPDDLDALEAIVQREQDTLTLENERRHVFHSAL